MSGQKEPVNYDGASEPIDLNSEPTPVLGLPKEEEKKSWIGWVLAAGIGYVVYTFLGGKKKKKKSRKRRRR